MSGTTCTCSGVCGCFEGIGVHTPEVIDNLPGLAAVAYRTGTHARFKASMLAELSRAGGALSGLTTRDDDDLSIALLDAFATVADVLTFYQERIANENYLRTATERRSVLELARAIGYELQPGVAASTVLAFTMDTTAGAPTTATVPAGVRVQSVPDPGRQAVTFETVESIEARPAWNVLKPLQQRIQTLPHHQHHVVFQGTATNVKVGDGILFTHHDGSLRFGIAVEVTLQAATDPAQSVTDVRIQQLSAPRRSGVALPHLPDPPLGPVALQMLGTSIDEESLQSLASQQKFDAGDLFTNLAEGTTAPALAAVLRTRAAVYGVNAPDYNTLPSTLTDPGKPFNGRSAWTGELLNDYWHRSAGGGGVFLDTSYPSIGKGGFAVVRQGQRWAAYRITDSGEVSHADFTLSAKVTRLHFDTDAGLSSFHIDSSTVFAGSELLPLARVPKGSPVTGGSVRLDGWVAGLHPGQRIVAHGDSVDVQGTTVTETAVITGVQHDLDRDGGTTITLKPALAQRYLRSSMTINANVAAATHGETVSEVVGSGDASQAFQKFTLRQPPITQVSARTPSGAQSTLQLWVDDTRWTEVPYLPGSKPSDHVYTTRIDDSAVATITGGDGRDCGARFPTGQENLRAVYRKGVGLSGLLRAGRLTMLTTRPAGVNGVTNPLPSLGAADPETLSEARTNAPLRMRTLDRIVSLQDYEDFARAFAGIAKALATWSHVGQVRGVMLTVAAPSGDPVPSSGDTYTNLLGAMQDAGDPYVPLRLATYTPVTFRIAAALRIAADRDPAIVGPAVEAALRSAFSFDARAFGQPVRVSEVYAVMQAVPGVVAVDLTGLQRVTSTSPTGVGPAPTTLPAGGALAAALPSAGQTLDSMQPAELITLDPAPLNLGTF